MSKTLQTFALIASATLVVTGCATDKYKNCPAASALVETSIATVFKAGRAPDPSNVLYTVEVTGVTATCDVDKQAVTSSSSVEVTFRATRAPNGGQANYQVPYFVAISQSERLLAKRVYVADFSFEPGETTTTFTQDIGSVDVSAGKDKKTFDYVILAGLQLSKEQLEYNRASGRLNP